MFFENKKKSKEETKEEMKKMMSGYQIAVGERANLIENVMIACDYDVDHLQNIMILYEKSESMRDSIDYLKKEYGKAHASRLNCLVGLSPLERDKVFREISILISQFI